MVIKSPSNWNALRNIYLENKYSFFHVKIINLRRKSSKFEFLGDRQTWKNFFLYFSNVTLKQHVHVFIMNFYHVSRKIQITKIFHFVMQKTWLLIKKIQNLDFWETDKHKIKKIENVSKNSIHFYPCIYFENQVRSRENRDEYFLVAFGVKSDFLLLWIYSSL